MFCLYEKMRTSLCNFCVLSVLWSAGILSASGLSESEQLSPGSYLLDEDTIGIRGKAESEV